ncbi:MAG TPA: phosphopantetheine-binding protein [Cyclobacteriaceae bacterium]
MQTVDELIPQLKELIIKQLNLEGVTPEAFDADMPLFGEGLGLDSIDAIELIVLLDRNYGIKLADPKEGKKVFQSVRTMAEFIQLNVKK